MNKEEYIEEIELIREQNDTEFEIYPMVIELIQPTIASLSKRYVFARRKSAKGQIYYGICCFPDVAILDKDYRNIANNTISKDDWKKLRGCLEVKALGRRLITQKQIYDIWSKKINYELLPQDIAQLIGEILWYKKVIYTNGIEWRYLTINNYSKNLEDAIIQIVNDRIEFESKNPPKEFNWWSHIKELEFEIIDICITKDCLANWEDFINRIKQINWI